MSAVIVGLTAFVTIFSSTIDAALAGFILAFATTITTDVSVVCVTLDGVLIPFVDFVYGTVVSTSFLLDADKCAIGSAVRQSRTVDGMTVLSSTDLVRLTFV